MKSPVLVICSGPDSPFTHNPKDALRTSTVFASGAVIVVSASYLVKINCIVKSLVVKQGIAFADSQSEDAVLDFDAVKLYSALVTKDVDAKLIDQLCMGE